MCGAPWHKRRHVLHCCSLSPIDLLTDLTLNSSLKINMSRFSGETLHGRRRSTVLWVLRRTQEISPHKTDTSIYSPLWAPPEHLWLFRDNDIVYGEDYALDSEGKRSYRLIIDFPGSVNEIFVGLERGVSRATCCPFMEVSRGTQYALPLFEGKRASSEKWRGNTTLQDRLWRRLLSQ